MSETVLQVASLVLIAVVIIVMILAVRRFWLERRRQALNVEPAVKPENFARIDISTGEDVPTRPVEHSLPRVRILAFFNEDSQQYRVLQAPVLRRVIEAKGDVVSVMYINAEDSPELTQRYHVLTVPTTVLLDAAGKAHAVNYGFTNAQSLLKQVDEIVALDSVQEAFS